MQGLNLRPHPCRAILSEVLFEIVYFFKAFLSDICTTGACWKLLLLKQFRVNSDNQNVLVVRSV